MVHAYDNSRIRRAGGKDVVVIPDAMVAALHRLTHPLKAREQTVLRLVVRSFIDTAGPVGSRTLARRHALGLSPASVRNTMGDLEELGYLRHPYTSAGRMPTELGYRVFVDDLMELPELSAVEKRLLKAKLDRLMGDEDELFRESSRILSRMSSLFGVVLSPKISTGILERLEVVPLASPRVMIVISVRSRLVQTIIYETRVELRRYELDRIVILLNERLAGLRLDEIRRTYADRTRDLDDDPTGIVQLILKERAVVFSDPAEGRLRRGGSGGLLRQPEFSNAEAIRMLIQLVEDEGFVLQLFEGQQQQATIGQATVSIGSEIRGAAASTYSIVTARYQLGETIGTVGILGPMRMDYERAIALVETLARLLNRPSIDVIRPKNLNSPDQQ